MIHLQFVTKSISSGVDLSSIASIPLKLDATWNVAPSFSLSACSAPTST